jgi:hypothetical protein
MSEPAKRVFKLDATGGLYRVVDVTPGSPSEINAYIRDSEIARQVLALVEEHYNGEGR